MLDWISPHWMQASKVAVKVRHCTTVISPAIACIHYDDFENVEELTPRTIGGVEMAGRTYKNVGMWWTEYYGEMPTGGWLAIKISGVDIDPGTEGDTVLNSVTFG